MLKIKNVFKIKLLIVVLFLASGPILMAKDLDFSTNESCNPLIQEYEINYDNAGNLEWIIEGGEIIELKNGNSPAQLADQFMGVQFYNGVVVNWLFSTNCTQLKFYGSSNVVATFDGIKSYCKLPHISGHSKLDFFLIKHRHIQPVFYRLVHHEV